MLYLLAQIFLLLLLAGGLGAFCAYLYLRRSFEDVTEQYESFQSVGALHTRVEDGLAALARVEKRQGRMEENLRSLTFPIPAEASPSRDQLSEIQVLLRRQQDLLSRMAGRTELAAALSPLEARLENLEVMVGQAPLPHAPDLSTLETRVGGLEELLGQFSIPRTPDLSPLESRLQELEHVLSDLERRKGLESSPVIERLHALEAAFGGLAGRIEALDAPPAAPAAEAFEAERRTDGSRNLLRRPAFGRADNLKKISGVGPVLESMLHGLGVYYFWQIADWLPEDIRFVDAKLTSFKGRIERDRWVDQAESLSTSPEARPRPLRPPGAERSGNGLDASTDRNQGSEFGASDVGTQ